ncbi:MAG TPA: hypothetical protein VJR89_35785, partial [Polyangiales bacterium]|nr:hypothetical protein [Polyangiales bacterium]
MQLKVHRWDVVRWTLQAAATAIALYYLLAYSSGCSLASGPLHGGELAGDVAGDASEGRGRSRVDAGGNGVAELELLDAGELEHDAAAAVDA